MRAIVFAALLATMAPSHAEVWLTSSIASWHQERGRYNELNPGIGIEYGSRLRFVAGVYRNSVRRNTAYAGAAYAPWHVGPVGIGGVLMFATGYSDRTILVPLPVLTYEGKRYGANLMVVPPLAGKSAVLGLQLKARF